jgi:hypothetical protein
MWPVPILSGAKEKDKKERISLKKYTKIIF